jgi:hypothetical protein
MSINPINPVYYIPQESFAEQFLPAMKMGQMSLQSQEMRRQADLAAEVETRRRNAVSEFMSNPDPSMIDISRFLAQLPDDQAKALSPALSKIPEEKIQGKVRFGAQVMQALRSDPTVAVKILQDQAKAEENSGKAQDAQFYRSIADDVTKNGPANAFRLTGALVGSLPGGKDAIAALAAAEEAQRKEITAPTEQKKLEAETRIKEQEAKTGPNRQYVTGADQIYTREGEKLVATGVKSPSTAGVVVNYGAPQSVVSEATGEQKLIQIGPQGQTLEVAGYSPDKPMTEGQSAALGFGIRAVESNKILNSLEKTALGDIKSYESKAKSAVPFIGNALSSPKYQEYNQAKLDFITAVLRKESGAAIGKDEFEKEDRKYFPQPGDNAGVIEQKKKARTTQILILQEQAGRKLATKVKGGYSPTDDGKTKATGFVSVDDLMKSLGKK